MFWKTINLINSDFLQEQKVTHGDYIINQVNCVLSLDRNRQSNYRNVSDLFETYNYILRNETTPGFKNSIEDSKSCFVAQCNGYGASVNDKIKALHKDVSDSFLIIPLLSNKHLLCAVVRKNNEGYSATLVNSSRGGRRGDDRGDHVAYEEYLFAKQNVAKLIDAINLTKHSWEYSSKLSTNQIYDVYKCYSDKKYPLYVVSRDQKDGNCYVKEVEKAIKYALATSHFTKDQFMDLRQPTNGVFKPKWPISTEAVHKRYVDKLRKENPELSNILNMKFQKYLEYKHYSSNKGNEKIQLNGRSIQSDATITFEDDSAKPRCIANLVSDGIWNHSDMNGKLIGLAKQNGDNTLFYDKDNQLVAVGKKEGIGEKYYDASQELIGYSRFYFGMKDYNGNVIREHKGIHPVDIMLNPALNENKSLISNNLYSPKPTDIAVSRLNLPISSRRNERGIGIKL